MPNEVGGVDQHKAGMSHAEVPTPDTRWYGKCIRTPDEKWSKNDHTEVVMERLTRWSCAGTLVLMALGGCASIQRDESARNSDSNSAQILSRAEESIERANDAGAQRYSTRDLNIARQKLSDARVAAEREDFALAERLGVEAELDAEYAEATADNEEMQAAVQELRNSLQTLREEIQRTAP